MPRKIEISHRTIIFIAVFIASLWFVYVIRDILILLFVSLLIMTILNPTVTKLARYKVPRVLSVLIVYLSLITLITVSIGVMVPPLIEQTTNFATNLPRYYEDLHIPSFVIDEVANEVATQVGKFPSQIVRISVSVFSNIMSVFAVFIFALYLLLARDKLHEQLMILFRDGTTEKKIERFLDKLEIKLGGWARGQILLMVIVGISTFIGLSLLGVPYAVPLALFAGLMEVIPNMGPTIAAIPAVIVGFGVSPITGVATIALSILIQQLENYLLVPKVMQRSVGISPIITLLALLVGFRLVGVVGAILSVPVVITLRVFFDEFVELPKRETA